MDDFSKQMDEALDEALKEQRNIINSNMDKLENGALKEFFKSSMKEARNKKNPFNSEQFVKNAANFMKDAS